VNLAVYNNNNNNKGGLTFFGVVLAICLALLIMYVL